MKYYQFNSIHFSLSSMLAPINNIMSTIEEGAGGGKGERWRKKKKTLTEDLHSDGRLPLLVPVGGDALVRPFILIPGIIQCEDRRWLIVEGDCDVWSVRFYPVPARPEPFYLLGDAYNWENKQGRRVRNEASDVPRVQPLHRRSFAAREHPGNWRLRLSRWSYWLKRILYFISVSWLTVKSEEFMIIQLII